MTVFRRARRRDPVGLISAEAAAELSERLAASERREHGLVAAIEHLTGELVSLGASVDTRLELVEAAADRAALEAATRTADDLGGRIDELTERTREDHRKHAASLDVVRRYQKAMDEHAAAETAVWRDEIDQVRNALAEQRAGAASDATRAAAAEHDLEASIAAIRAALADAQHDEAERIRRLGEALEQARRERVEDHYALRRDLDAAANAAQTRHTEWQGRADDLDRRTARLEVTAEMAGDRLAELDHARAESQAALERAAGLLGSAQTAIVHLTSRAGEAEIALVRHAEHVTAVAKRLDRTDGELSLRLEATSHLLGDTRAHLTRLDDQAAQTAERVDLVIDRIEPLAQAVSDVERLAATVDGMDDRMTKAELLLNQRDDLELQLDRVEEFERLLAEVDPDRFASREDLNELRRLFEESVRIDHEA